ncbi:hypothetical protein [Microbacterium sp. Clip185]|uniref:hypothetical protein n=1 Tax=Microbacterium sp. Clip185 TaxID=3025663 RepID=UPI00236583BE|nr:hypothetical protein [Microbacterium sp. Clip185]WDG18264.1 hypothetical protein PQV94_00665 [Microbacterium sp. Clip185]
MGDAEIALSAREAGTRGWVRRVAPADWLIGVQAESLDAAVRGSWLTLIGALLRSPGLEWLTRIDDISAAENKLVLDAAARRLGLATPVTLVTNDPSLVRSELGGVVSAKPLGPGHYFTGDRAFNVFATEVSTSDLDHAALAQAPFLLQERLHARVHHRVVVVDGQVWGASLDATNLPLDWRSEPRAHRSFVANAIPRDLAVAAVALAAELRLGYSSQDWIETDSTFAVLDVNPGGQWMFLPEPLGDEVASAIARWLSHGS